MNFDLNIHKTYELLKDSYKKIDFRSAIYNKDNKWHRILSILRFSNESNFEINKKYNNLDLKRYETKNFKIQHEILEISEWEDKLVELYNEIYEDIEIYDIDEFYYNETKYQEYQSSFLDQFKAYFSTPSLRFFFTEEEVNSHNLLNIYYSIANRNEHHSRFNKILNEAILKLGEDNIYDIINRTLQLDDYNSQNSLYISLVFPIYLNINDLAYSKGILSGKVQFHEIYEKTKIFFRIYSNPKFSKNSLKGREEIIILKEAPKTKEIDNGFSETSFNIDFKKYNCSPNFEIRALWDKFPKLHLIDIRQSFGSPRSQQPYGNLAPLNIENDEELFIKYKFKEYGLVDYEFYINLVNNIAYHNYYFVLLPILLRCLFENLLHDILRNSIPNRCAYFYYNDDRGRVRDFGILINLLNILSKKEYKKYIKNRINEKIIEIIKEIQKDGNLSVHEIQSIITSDYSSKIQERINIALGALLASYTRLNKEIEITPEREQKIKRKLNLSVKGDKKKKEPPIKRTDIKNKSSLQKIFEYFVEFFDRFEEVEKPKNDNIYKNNRNYIYFKYRLLKSKKEGYCNENELKHKIIDAGDNLKRFLVELGYYNYSNIKELINGYFLKLPTSGIKIEQNKISIHRSKEHLFKDPKNLKLTLRYFLTELLKLAAEKNVQLNSLQIEVNYIRTVNIELDQESFSHLNKIYGLLQHKMTLNEFLNKTLENFTKFFNKDVIADSFLKELLEFNKKKLHITNKKEEELTIVLDPKVSIGIYEISKYSGVAPQIIIEFGLRDELQFYSKSYETGESDFLNIFLK